MRDLDCQLEYWNVAGPAKPFAHPINLDRLSQWLTPGSRILDYGCGYGRALECLWKTGYRNLLGVDPAPAMIEAARDRVPYARCERLLEPPRVDVATESIDAVLLFTVLTCVPADEGQRGILDEVHRVLRPGGLVYISDLWLQTDDRNQRRYARDAAKYGIFGVFDLPEGVTVRHHTAEWLDCLTAGYERLALDDIDVQTMNGHAARGFRFFGRKVGPTLSRL
jgi:SAM-dependent methyltransferase